MELMNLQTAKDHTNKLREVTDQIEKHLRCLEALGEDVNHHYFVSLIISKLPKEIILKLEEQKVDEVWTVKSIRDKIQKIISAKESVGYQVGTSGNFKHPLEITERYKANKHFTTETLIMGTGGGTSQKLIKKCRFCDDSHWSDECDKYTTVSARKQKIKGSCFICLKKGHFLKDCTFERPCVYCKQTKNHHRSLCPRRNITTSTEATCTVTETGSNTTTQSNNESSLLATGERVLLQTATTLIKNIQTNQTKTVKLILDSGSQRSYITESLTKSIKLDSKGKEILSVFTFGSNTSKTIETPVVEIDLMILENKWLRITTNVVQHITGNILQSKFDTNQLSGLYKTLPLADHTLTEGKVESTIELLIGNDYYWDIISSEKILINPGLYLIGSQLGWIVSGRLQTSDDKLPSTVLLTYSYQTQGGIFPFFPPDQTVTPNFNIKDWWDLETIGISDQPEETDDDRALKEFNDSIEYYKNRYFVTWPWKGTEIDLPENYQLAYGRLNSLLKRYAHKPQLLKQYNDIIVDQLQKGIIEVVDSNSKEGTKKHYIPHHPVISPTKSTTKLRIVYDGSSRAGKGNKSINECLYRGPALLEDLCGLLLRFRVRNIAIIADIEKAFLQIGLQEEDRDVTRFLWIKDTLRPTTEENLQIFRFTRIPFGIISSPFLLNATIQYHLRNNPGETASRLIGNIYVDNLIVSVNTVEEGIKLYEETKMIFQKASMNIREWNSNSPELTGYIPKSDQLNDKQIKVLGLRWDTKQDDLYISNSLSEMAEVTKREILKFTASFFDPLGLFSPSILIAKLFIQQLWADGLDWDDTLDQVKSKKWKEISSSLLPIPSLSIPRFIGIKGLKDEDLIYELHCFTDASRVAFAAAVYILVRSKDHITSHLMFSKSKLAPTKVITIPRLELLGVCIGYRSLLFVERNLRITIKQKYLWTDSQCVLFWIDSKKELPLFIKRRLKEIESSSDIVLRYTPTDSNPADIATRGIGAQELSETMNWWYGPQWLQLDPEKWPQWNMPKTTVLNETLKSEERLYEATIIAQEKTQEHSSDMLSPFEIEETRFSSLNRLIRVTAWSMRFIKLLRKIDPKSEMLTMNELREAKCLWEKYVQHKYLPELFLAIGNKPKNLLKKQLGLWLDQDEVIRCSGRLVNADISDEAKFPKLLPKNTHYTNLIIEDMHRKLFHAGTSHTLAKIRLEYWIPQGRVQVGKVIHRCNICRKFDGGPYKLPEMPPWPKAKVSFSPPFTHTGVDYLGPLYVKRGSSVNKVWICIFTCLVVRAVHLELIEDMTAEEFLMCLRRFVARRGVPYQIISDNAQQFKLTKGTLEDL